MASLGFIPVKLLRGMTITLAALVFLPVLLLAALLILIAPFPQIAIHAQWCYNHLGLIGWVVLVVGAFGVSAVAIGMVRRRTKLRRVGILLVIGPVVGVAFHRSTATGNWQDISLLVAFVLSVLVMYLATNVGDDV